MVPKFWPAIPCFGTLALTEMWFPWGSGMFATSLGSQDACFVIAATMTPGSGYMVVWGYLCAWQKWYIEWSKVDQCKQGWIGMLTCAGPTAKQKTNGAVENNSGTLPSLTETLLNSTAFRFC